MFRGRSSQVRYSTVRLVLLFCWLGLPSIYSWCQQSPVSFGGIVASDAGTPVPGAIVRFNNQATCTPSPSGGPICSGLISSSATTDANGRFLVTGVPAGTWILCADAMNLWNSCDWGGGQTYVTLQPGESNTSLTFVMHAGTVVRIHVFDRDHVMEGPFGIGVGLVSYASATSGGIGHDTFQQAAPPNYVFTATIPPTASAKLDLQTGSAVVVLNEAGESIPSSAPSPSPTITGGPDTIDVNLTVTAPLVNAASYWPSVARGGIASLFDSGITNADGIVMATGFPLPTQLAGTSVTVYGTPAPVLAVANVNGQQQINFQIPHTITDNSGTVVVNNNGTKKIYYSVVGAGLPGIFVQNGQPAIEHGATGSLVSASNPSQAGEIVTIWATGLDCVFPYPQDGVPAPASSLSSCTAQPKVLVNGQPATLLFAGRAPGLVGVDQLNVQLPQTLQTGAASLAVVNGHGDAGNTVQIPVQ